MANKMDALDAYSHARAVVEQWRDEFVMEWNRPLIELSALQAWNRLPPAAQELFKQQNPEAYDKLQEIIKRIKGGNNGRS